jgi:hypothetical protein
MSRFRDRDAINALDLFLDWLPASSGSTFAPLLPVRTGQHTRWGGRPPTTLKCQSGGVEALLKEASASQITTIGLDITKTVFHAHGADERGVMVFSRKLTRAKLLDFFAGQLACALSQ